MISLLFLGHYQASGEQPRKNRWLYASPAVMPANDHFGPMHGMVQAQPQLNLRIQLLLNKRLATASIAVSTESAMKDSAFASIVPFFFLLFFDSKAAAKSLSSFCDNISAYLDGCNTAARRQADLRLGKKILATYHKN